MLYFYKYKKKFSNFVIKALKAGNEDCNDADDAEDEKSSGNDCDGSVSGMNVSFTRFL